MLVGFGMMANERVEGRHVVIVSVLISDTTD